MFTDLGMHDGPIRAPPVGFSRDFSVQSSFRARTTVPLQQPFFSFPRQPTAHCYIACVAASLSGVPASSVRALQTAVAHTASSSALRRLRSVTQLVMHQVQPVYMVQQPMMMMQQQQQQPMYPVQQQQQFSPQPQYVQQQPQQVFVQQPQQQQLYPQVQMQQPQSPPQQQQMQTQFVAQGAAPVNKIIAAVGPRFALVPKIYEYNEGCGNPRLPQSISIVAVGDILSPLHLRQVVNQVNQSAQPAPFTSHIPQSTCLCFNDWTHGVFSEQQVMDAGGSPVFSLAEISPCCRAKTFSVLDEKQGEIGHLEYNSMTCGLICAYICCATVCRTPTISQWAWLSAVNTHGQERLTLRVEDTEVRNDYQNAVNERNDIFHRAHCAPMLSVSSLVAHPYSSFFSSFVCVQGRCMFGLCNIGCANHASGWCTAPPDFAWHEKSTLYGPMPGEENKTLSVQQSAREGL